MDRTVKLALGSVAVGCVVLGLKFLAYWLTGSVALFSDALESIINIAAACAAVMALRVSSIPADANHPYGHSKAEYFSSVIEGVLIVIAALAILREAYFGFLDPQPIDAPTTGLAINGLASLLNGAWSWLLIRNGRRWRSPALIADGKHLFTDVVTSGGVLIGVALVGLTGWLVLDPLLAALVALNILWSGWGLVRESVGGLMDEAAPPDMLDRIRALISNHADGALEAHDLRTRHAGRRTFIEFHLVVPGTMNVAEAHDICDRIEEALKNEIEDSTITIHVEPEMKAKQTGVLVL
ncbi:MULTISPECIES: cation diffusion facilitator family transporter [Aurantimonadaceae]|nr:MULTISPECIES: cation diffusion facilitator family transporter [Aurantimonadaceae]ORE96987.1 cation diffusion facilitator family transporter [Aurantimonas sp. 22II-16-19i]WAP71435.1 cation diffusion facilitator family transporter [Jiella pelagia]